MISVVLFLRMSVGITFDLLTSTFDLLTFEKCKILLYLCSVIKKQTFMKTFKNPFRALVELRNVGSNVVAVKVSTSMRLNALDLNHLSDYIVHSLLPLGFVYRRFYDGTYLFLSFDSSEVTEFCIPSQDRAFDPLDAEFELEDGLVHGVSITFNQSKKVRNDYCFGQARYLHLVGEVSINVDDGLSDGDTCEE